MESNPNEQTTENKVETIVQTVPKQPSNKPLTLRQIVLEPHRLKMLTELARGKWRAPINLKDSCKLKSSQLYYHLRLLKQAGLIEADEEARQVHGGVIPHTLTGKGALVCKELGVV